MVVLDDGAVAGGAGVAAGSAVAVGVDPGGLFEAGLAGIGIRRGRGFGEEARGGGGERRVIERVYGELTEKW